MDLSARFGGTLSYEYHRQFSARAASRLQQLNTLTYWGALDLELYCRIFSGKTANTCNLCNCPAHPTTSCTYAAPAPQGPPRPSTSHQPSPAIPSLFSAPSFPPSRNNYPAASKAKDRRGRPLLFLGSAIISTTAVATCHPAKCSIFAHSVAAPTPAPPAPRNHQNHHGAD